MAPRDDRVTLLEALAVTAELTGTDLSPAAARVMATDLAAYPHVQVLDALNRCRRELKGRLTIAAVIERLDDGRPGPNEAWAMIPQVESGSVVWTDEMSAAFGVAAPLLREGQVIAARSAFLEAYSARVSESRASGRPARWTPSLGDPSTQTAALEEAARKGRLPREFVAKLLPPPDNADATLLTSQRAPIPAHVREQLEKFKLKLVGGNQK